MIIQVYAFPKQNEKKGCTYMKYVLIVFDFHDRVVCSIFISQWFSICLSHF